MIQALVQGLPVHTHLPHLILRDVVAALKEAWPPNTDHLQHSVIENTIQHLVFLSDAAEQEATSAWQSFSTS
jgi:hypothetical protein